MKWSIHFCDSLKRKHMKRGFIYSIIKYSCLLMERYIPRHCWICVIENKWSPQTYISIKSFLFFLIFLFFQVCEKIYGELKECCETEETKPDPKVSSIHVFRYLATYRWNSATVTLPYITMSYSNWFNCISRCLWIKGCDSKFEVKCSN